MSEVNANITVSPINLTVTPTDNQITITPSDITLSVYTAGQGTPGAAGIQGQLQFNNLGVLAGAANTQVTANGNVRFQNIGNLKINGGSNAYFLQTDGTGNLTWAPGTSIVSGSGTSAGANTQIQISDGSGNFTSGPGFTFDNVSNIMTAPGNVYAPTFIGTLANGNSNITMATANGNIDFYVNGNTSTKITDNQLVTNNLNLTSNTVSLGAFSNVNGGGQGVSIGYGTGAINPGIDAVIIGDGAGRSNVGANAVAVGIGAGFETMGANSVAIGAYAGYNSQNPNSIIINATGTNLDALTTNAFYVKPIRNANTGNILFYDNSTGEISYDTKPVDTIDSISNGTSNVSILTSNGNVNTSVAGNANVFVVTGNGAYVYGNLSAANANLGNLVNANFYTGNGSLLTGIVAIGGNANYANFAGNVVGNSQPNITSVGTLANLTIAGNLTLNSTIIRLGENSVAPLPYNIAIGANANTFGSNSSIAIGRDARSKYNTNAIAIGSYAYSGDDPLGGTGGIAIGTSAGRASGSGIAIGDSAGRFGNATRTISIGINAGNLNQSNNSIAIGDNAAGNAQGSNSIAIGYQAALSGQGANSIAIGFTTVIGSQGNNSIAIGKYIGGGNPAITQGSNSIAIGANAMGTANQASNSIILNATGGNLDNTVANSLVVKPIRDVTSIAGFTVQLYYNPTTGEIGYK